MPSLRRRLLRQWVPFAVLVAGLIVTAVLTWSVLLTTREADVARFQTTTDEVQHLIEIRLNTYVELLRAGAALFVASAEVMPGEFRSFVGHLQIGQRYPGIQGVGFAHYIPDAGVARTPIAVLEPNDRRNRAALGFDMFSEPTRRAAMQRARDTGQPSASGKVTLVQEIEGPPQAGFLIYMPVFRDDALRGFVFSPFRGDDLLRGILGTQRGLGFHVYDGTREDPSALLHETPAARQPSPQEPLRSVKRLDVAGRPWTVVIEAYQGFGGSSPWLAPGVLLAGVLLSFALFGITRAQFLAWQNEARYAGELRASEEAQREAGERLRRLVALERDARAQAQQADRAKDEFLATLSHELRTPLNAMLGWITMLRSGRVREERRAGALEVIERNARTQARLIEDLLDVSRIITGKIRLDLQPLQVAPLVQTALETLRPAAESKGLRLRAAMAADAPPVLGDSSRIQQIVWNLLSNAIKFTPTGGTVDVAVDRDGDAARITVRDSGIGIDPAFLPHVFERFRQADASSTRQHSGVGLGLSIVRHLVDLHHGRIDAHSEGADRGATFVVRLPAAARAAGAREDERGSLRATTLAGIHVLLVEDDTDTREMLEEALLTAGAQVTSAASAEVALHALGGERDIHAIVSDIAMAGTDGYELMQRIRRLPGTRGGLPAVAVTAYARAGDRDRALQAGFQAHLSKPVDLEDLVRTVERLVHNARRHAV